MVLSDIVIVLCRATEPGNVGAVCRVMKNMGLSRLRMVAPGPLDETSLLARAIHAEDVWRSAGFFDSLAEATADCSLVVGTTCRRGKKRKTTMEPRARTAWLAGRDSQGDAVALVFGNERAGLDAEEIELCNFASHIPVDEVFPSLNLSHAAAIYIYELFKALDSTERGVKGQWVPLDQQAINVMVGELTDNLKNLGFYKKAGREEQERFFRDLISRAALTERECRYFANIIAKSARLASKEESAK